LGREEVIIRDILYEGEESRSFRHVFEKNGKITAHMKSVFDPWTDEETDEASITLVSDLFLNCIAEARKNVYSRVESGENYIEFNGKELIVNSRDYKGNFAIHANIDFDSLFLNSFSVIENSELKRREAKDIILGPVEKAIIDNVNLNSQILNSFTPREFEVFIGSLLAKIGFYNITLSRFVKDGGYDLYAIYCEGEKEYSVVVEVKHYTKKKVGLEIVDRLNGVRSRMLADKAIIFTTSKFSATVKSLYSANNGQIALVDYEKIKNILSKCSEQWTRTPSDLWLCDSKTGKLI
jgi:HJR/Mrr/RecB family endonuclease